MIMKNSKRNLFCYLYTPVFMVMLGYLTIYLAGAPLFQLVSAVSGMVISKSAPTFTDKVDSIFNEHSKRAYDKIDENQITMPLYETCYANISCKQIGLSAPIFWGDSDKVLKIGVGQYIGSFMPGYGKPLLMSAHNCTFFEPLKNIKKGDTIQITTNYGQYEYQVNGTKITTAHDTAAYNLIKEEEELILYTCYPFGVFFGSRNKRYFVYADKISGPQIIEGGTENFETE